LTGFIIINNLNSNKNNDINLTISYFIRYNDYHQHLQHNFLSRLIVPSKIFQNIFLYSAYNLYFTSFIIAQISELCLSHFKKMFIFVKELKAEIYDNAQYVYMTTSTGYCWIVVYSIFTLRWCEFEMKK